MRFYRSSLKSVMDITNSSIIYDHRKLINFINYQHLFYNIIMLNQFHSQFNKSSFISNIYH
jgi:hypothetical protein